MDESLVIELYSKYDSCRMVAEEFGVSSETIRRILIKNGIKRKGNRQRCDYPKRPSKKYCPALVGMLIGVLGLDAKKVSDTLAIPYCSVLSILDRKYPYLKIGKGNKYRNVLEKYAGTDITICEIARRENLSQSGLNGYALRHGYKERNPNGNGTELGHEIQRNRAIAKLTEKAKSDSGEYIDHTHTIFRCNECGTVFKRTRVYTYPICCPTCRDAETIERKKQHEREQEQERLDRERERAEELAKDKICESCGHVFHSENKTAKYCSGTCSRREKRRRDTKAGKMKLRGFGHRKRARLHGVAYDPSVRLDRLIKRDSNTCQICGLPCDKNDNRWSKSFGPLYPTIDHIIAMVNGGSHTWDNVQLAHAFCNSAKRDLTDEEFTDEVKDEIREQVLDYIFDLDYREEVVA